MGRLRFLGDTTVEGQGEVKWFRGLLISLLRHVPEGREGLITS
jgi:hypothetical protein